MKRIYCLLLTANCLLLFACSNKDKQVVIPDNILPKAKMARVITDIHLQQAEMNLHSLPDTTQKESVDFQKIFLKDTITQQQYEESLNFYIDHPELLNGVYEEVVNELSKMQAGTK